MTPLTPDAGDWGSSPIYATSPPKDKRLFVVERGGNVRIVKDGVLQPIAFLAVQNVDTDGERGLLSIAFPPNYATSGLVYVFAVVAAQLRVIEYHVSSNPDIADSANGRIVLAQPIGSATNHNGGQLVFGPDGYLYVSMGENGNSANAQSPTTDLGKILRINPRQSGASQFTIPPGNPVDPAPGAKPEIWARGLRNPYRASFAPDGNFVIADVGDGALEEVDYGFAGANYGWPSCEGINPHSPGNTCGGFAGPVFTYGHQVGVSCAIIGGYVVRDPTLTGLTGQYLFGDNCDAPLRKIKLGAENSASPAGLTATDDGSVISFGEDVRGCVYVMADGTAYRVVATAGDSAACPLAFPPDPVSGGAPGASAVKIASNSLREDSKGRVAVKLTCTTPVSCRAVVELRSSKKLRLRRGGRATKFLLGKTKPASIGAGMSKTFLVKLRRGPRHVLHARNKLRTQIRAAIGGVDAVKTVTLREAGKR